MNTEILTDLVEETLEEIEPAKFCCIRHDDCPSSYAICGTFKPYPHSVEVFDFPFPDNNVCNVCGKETCPKCIKVSHLLYCPQCGE